MITQEYRESAVEVLDILDNTEKQDFQKIPSSFIKFLVDIADSDYKVNLDHSKTISELELKDKTNEFLGYIYINWWSSEKEQKIYESKINEIKRKKQEELNKKYNTDNLFKNRQENYENEQNIISEKVQLVKYKENIFNKIISKIINFFK